MRYEPLDAKNVGTGTSTNDYSCVDTPLPQYIDARGATREDRRVKLVRPVFIPAHAGNGIASRWPGIRKPVHPRARGERVPFHPISISVNGSSPRTRGTVTVSPYPFTLFQFIPAYAGNGHSSTSTVFMVTVHPRARGERGSHALICATTSGSSPRTRGTGMPAPPHRGARRFIPAHAGNG